MKTSNNKRAVALGIFIVIGIAIFIAGILTLGNQKKTFERKITVRAIFNDAGGLHSGNNVWFLGVKVGTIKKISFIAHSQVEIIMNIEANAQDFIKKDAKAKVSSDGFIGNKIVVIYGGTDNSTSIADNDMLAVENGLSTDEVLATFQENNKNLLEITANIKELSKQIMMGKGAAGKLLTDPVLANNLDMAVAGFKQASANAQRLTANISAYTARLQSEGSLTNDLITDTTIFSGLKSAVSQFREMTKTGNEVTENLKQASKNINAVSTNLNSNNSPVGVLLNDPKAGNNLQLLLANLQSGSKKLDDNMEALQHNFLLRGFFKKKAKAEKKNMIDSADAKVSAY